MKTLHILIIYSCIEKIKCQIKFKYQQEHRSHFQVYKRFLFKLKKCIIFLLNNLFISLIKMYEPNAVISVRPNTLDKFV